MRCDFCGDNLEGAPFQKDGMIFCSLECSDALETGETIPLGEEILDDPDDYDDDDYDLLDEADVEDDDDEYAEDEIFDDIASDDL